MCIVGAGADAVKAAASRRTPKGGFHNAQKIAVAGVCAAC